MYDWLVLNMLEVSVIIYLSSE